MRPPLQKFAGAGVYPPPLKASAVFLTVYRYISISPCSEFMTLNISICLPVAASIYAK